MLDRRKERRMGRRRKFSEEEIADAAIEIFMSKGYRATSIQDVVEATNIQPGSLYGAFGSKSGLFEAVLDRYDATSPVLSVVEHSETAPPKETIVRLLEDIARGRPLVKRPRGCLITNSATELAGADAAMAARVRKSLQRLEDALCRLVERGQESGEFTNGQPARDLARYLVTVIQGLQVMTKVEPDRAVLKNVVRTALSVLG
jgi:TetR/AcrR family transcriptional repressor of nem operon